MATLYLGGPIWTQKRWVGNFFPTGARPADFLALYSRRLSTVENHSTFYSLPAPHTVQRWREQTPPDFRFCCKFPRLISHERRLLHVEEETAEWVARLRQLGDRAGPSFLQLPPDFGPAEMPTLTAYLDRLPPDLPVAVEVRHPGWFHEHPAAALARELSARGRARVNYDVRPLRAPGPRDELTLKALDVKPEVPVTFELTAPFILVRFVSHPTAAGNQPFYAEWAPKVAGWLAVGVDVYFCIQHADDFLAPSLCRDFHEEVARLMPGLPALPSWPAPGRTPERQGSLF